MAVEKGTAGPLEGKVVVVTGGAGGIGAAAAQSFAARGARVVVVDRDVVGGKAVADDLGEDHEFVELDVTDPAAWTASLAAIADAMGRIDIVCLNAAIMSRPKGARIDDNPELWFNEEVYRRVVSVNQDGVAFGAMAALPYLKRTGGSLLMTASGAGVRPIGNDPLYAMSKHAVVGLGTSLAVLAAEHGVRVNVFCPTATDTSIVAPDIKERGEFKLMRPADAGKLLADVAMLPTGGGLWLVVAEPPAGVVRRFDNGAAVDAVMRGGGTGRPE